MRRERWTPVTMVAVTSACASPGASALAVALGMARCRAGTDEVVVVEADPAGGRFGPRFGFRNDPSLATYVADSRRGSSAELLLRNTQRIGSLAVMPCPVDPELTRQVLSHGGEALAAMLGQGQLDSVVDLGRVDDGSAALPFAVHADQVLLVTRPRFDEVQALLFRRRTLIEAGCTVGLVTVGDEPHHPDEVAEFAGLPLLAALPEDAAIASAFCGGRFDRKRLVRTRLWSTVLSLADRLWSSANATPESGVPEAVDAGPVPDGEPPGPTTGGDIGAPAVDEKPAPRPAKRRTKAKDTARESAP